uniref:uncharacterized protein LOC122586325 n=1 Tax=Erigeron canadensis TaxID=72917 RepID=UPI001CB8A41A|nr:uncharacterized protein LOC122586325 [Erigeron canadensis]
MAASASKLFVLKTLLSVLSCVMAAALAYGFIMDYFSTCFDPRARWMQVGLVDFLINVSPIMAWYFYKESRWIMRVMFMFILFWFGSVTICGYILLQFFKLSPEQTLKDPFFFALARPQNRDDDVMGASNRRGGFSVVTTRIIYASLGCLMLAFPVFAWITDGSPFRAQVLSPCMVTLLTDLCIQAVVYSVWIGYKESSWINTLFWILCIVCFGSIGLCGYIVRELFYLTPDQPVYLILFNTSNRDVMLSDPLLLKNHHLHHHHGNI